MSAYLISLARFFLDWTFTIAAVKVVLPWSMCPMVPTFTCGFERTNFSLAMRVSPDEINSKTLVKRSSALRASDLRDDLLLNLARHGHVVGELHRVRGAALRAAAEVGRVSEHRGERHFGVDDLRVAALGHTEDPAATRVQVADDVAHVILGRDDLDAQDRLEQVQPRPLGAVLERERARDFERLRRGVDLVVRAVVELDLDVDDGVAREHAAVHRLADALLDGRNELLRDGAADDLVLEDEARPALARLEPDEHVAVLAAPAGLLGVLVLGVDLLRDALAIRDFGLADVRLDLELAPQAVDDDFEVELAHAGDDRLRGFFVGERAKRRIFVGELLQRDAELLDVDLGLRLDGDRDDRLGEDHLLEDDRLVLLVEGVAGARVAQADGRVDVAGVALGELFALVRVHAQDASDALSLRSRRVHHHRAALELARVHAEEGQVAVRIVDDLERVPGEGLAVVDLTDFRLVVVGVDSLDRRNVERGGQVVDDAVEQELDALVLEGRPAEHGDQLERAAPLAERRDDLGFGHLVGVPVQELRHDAVVHVGAGFDHLLAHLGALRFEIGGDLRSLPLLSLST